MNRLPLHAIGICTSALLLGGVGCKESRNTGATPKYTIGFSQTTVKEPWRVLFNERLQEAARRHPEVKLTIRDAEDRTEEQVAQMRTLIRQRVSAILVSPKEAPGLTRPVEEATAAGIPVIVLDRDVNTDKYAAFVGGDNREIGYAAGGVAIRLLGGTGRAKGNIYEICGGLASTPAQERRDGFHDAVKKEPGIKFIESDGLDADCDWKEEKARANMMDILKNHEDIDLVYAHNDAMAHGAYLAAKEVGRADRIKFIGIDGMANEGQRWVTTGELTATLLYPTPGEKGLEIALDILNGTPVQKRNILPTRVFTRGNVDFGGDPVPPPTTAPAAAKLIAPG